LALSGAAAWPLAASAQQSAMPVIGFLGAIRLPERLKEAFLRRLAEQGLVEGRNVAFEYRFAEGRYERMAGLAAELVRRPVTVIVASPTPPSVVVKAATTTIPIVFGVTDDPVKLGLVTSLPRPGGNATGVYFFCPIWRRNNSGFCASWFPPRCASVCWSIPTMPTPRL
jgi:putative tryptophan/tyrosine transport system substrate-binding protein